MTKLGIKRIKEFPGYSVGINGNIYSYWVVGRSPRIDYSKKPRVLSGGLSGAGYLQVNLVRNRTHNMRGIHRLVASTFIGPIFKGYAASHKDGNRLNNKLSNLCIETYSKNHRRRRVHGTDDRGYRNSRAKINKKQLFQVKKLIEEGKLTFIEIGNLLGVTGSFIRRIKRVERYGDL